MTRHFHTVGKDSTMPLLEDIRRFFKREKRSKPVEIDLTGTQAEGLSDSARDGESQSEGDGNLAPITARNARPRTMNELQRGYDDVMSLVRKIGDHLDSQTERTDRMMSMMEHLPQAIDALPEINRQNARLLDVLSDHLTQTKEREQALNDTLRRLGESSDHHAEVLSVLQQQLDTNHRAAEQMTETLGSFREALVNLAETNNRSTNVLARITEAGNERESKLTLMFQQTQRWMLIVGGSVGALAIVAIILAILAITR
jgi:chromosome segregation ATPase